MKRGSKVRRELEDRSLPAEWREALSAGHQDGPTAEAQSRLRGAIAAGLVGGAATGATSSAAATTTAGAAAGLGAVGKAIVGVVLAVAAAGTGYAVLGPPGATGTGDRLGHDRATSPELHAAPLTSPALDIPAERVVPPEAEEPAEVSERGAPLPRPIAEPLPEPEHAHPREIDLVRGARAALDASPESALASVTEHERLFPDGVFVQEREVIAVEALVRLGRVDAARSRAERFLAAHPGSSHAPRVRRLVGQSGSGGIPGSASEDPGAARTDEDGTGPPP